ncbi:hypothetical protein FE257_011652 [Aspergillus nanangensis]|uniref:ERCC4 domain-containing protein n=1 Tax=Aspergillus nanangensis TaxID=2582783 RepID=A0AAD4CV08_ASPNN|nr:hypothetical protein FE257_011652 [Aspergillus nanangensis]
MPDIIDLVSDDPLPPSYQPPRPSSCRSAPSTPAAPRVSGPPLFPSDDIDISLFTYDDDEFDNPPKRRRLSDDRDLASHYKFKYNPNPPKNTNTVVPASRNPLFLFSDEDHILSSEGPGPTVPSPRNANNPISWGGLESDPIVFDSSMPEQPTRTLISRPAIRRPDAITIDDDNDKNNYAPSGGYGVRGGRGFGDDIEGFSDDIIPPDLNELLAMSENAREVDSRPGFSSRTAHLLANLESHDSIRSGGKAPTTSHAIDKESDDDVASVDKRPSRKTTKSTTVDKQAKAKEKEAAKARRDHERQLEKERKQKLKEEKARDKAREKQHLADLSEANRRKIDKKDSTHEMILDLAKSFEGTTVGSQTVEHMNNIIVEHSFFESPISSVVKWRRKVKARFNESLGYWEPCPLHIQKEDHVLILLLAQDFVDMAICTDPSTTDLTTHVQMLKSAFPNCKPIYLIEGLVAWMRKNHNSRNRAFRAEVRRQFEESQDPPTSTQLPARKRTTASANKPETTPPVDDDTIEDALLDLQVTHSCLIHHTSTSAESAEWIKNFTEHVSTVPYRHERMEGNDSAFCMDGGQVKSGENKTDTYVKMLQEVNRVTASMAYGIAESYPSVVDLVQGMRRTGPGMLENVKKSTNKNGTLADARIGPAASKRLYKVFMGSNPASTDI